MLLCFSLAGSFGGGLYEHIVLTPIWSAAPPSSFAIIQRGTGVPLQRFWIPVHAAITGFILWALFLDVVQRASRHHLVPLLSVGSLLAEEVLKRHLREEIRSPRASLTTARRARSRTRSSHSRM